MSESQALAVINKAIEERGIKSSIWSTLTQTLYPGASPNSVLLAWDYCQARGLDPMKKPVHIVPMRVKVGDEWQWRDTILPGIYEYRITAHRTGEYLGHDKPVYGPDREVFGVTAPESCEYTVYRWNEKAQQKVGYTVEIKFAESCGTKRRSQQDATLVANGRWERAPVQMLTKCAEAAALREAFPEEIGGVPTMEEIEDHMPEVIDITAESAQIPTAWAKLPEPMRDNLEKAFTALKMTSAQRLTKVNEFIKTGSEDEAQALLDWCKDEYARSQGKTRTKPDNSNRKVTEKPPEPHGEAAMPLAPGSGGAGGSASSTDTEAVTAAQIPFAGAKAKTPLAEVF